MLTSFGGIKLFNFVCLNFDDFFEYCPVSIVRGHPYKLYKKRCNSNVRKKLIFPTENSLPFTVDFSALRSFKRSRVQVDFTILVCV